MFTMVSHCWLFFHSLLLVISPPCSPLIGTAAAAAVHDSPKVAYIGAIPLAENSSLASSAFSTSPAGSQLFQSLYPSLHDSALLPNDSPCDSKHVRSMCNSIQKHCPSASDIKKELGPLDLPLDSPLDVKVEKGSCNSLQKHRPLAWDVKATASPSDFKLTRSDADRDDQVMRHIPFGTSLVPSMQHDGLLLEYGLTSLDELLVANCELPNELPIAQKLEVATNCSDDNCDDQVARHIPFGTSLVSSMQHDGLLLEYGLTSPNELLVTNCLGAATNCSDSGCDDQVVHHLPLGTSMVPSKKLLKELPKKLLKEFQVAHHTIVVQKSTELHDLCQRASPGYNISHNYQNDEQLLGYLQHEILSTFTICTFESLQDNDYPVAIIDQICLIKEKYQSYQPSSHCIWSLICHVKIQCRVEAISEPAQLLIGGASIRFTSSELQPFLVQGNTLTLGDMSVKYSFYSNSQPSY
ncbi:hypothetical protein C8J56DRAFT_1115965 [Mycena floridula]|nr:hypothetical protein C8J56DRAFT_1115965 [Mycena floridula]